MSRLLMHGHTGSKSLTHKRIKVTHTSADEMVSAHFLAAPAASLKRRMERSSNRDDVDDFLSSDLERSFASTSLDSPGKENLALTPDSEKEDAMDISPIVNCREPSKQAATSAKTSSRPRAFTSSARMFGTDCSNIAPSLTPASQNQSKLGSTSAKRTQRSALPAEWLASTSSSSRSESGLFANIPEPSSPSDDAMDVDTSLCHEESPANTRSCLFSTVPQSAAATVSTFTNLFYDPMSPSATFESPSVGRLPKKRRSASPDLEKSATTADVSSSPGMPSSPSDRKFNGGVSNSLFSQMDPKPTLQGLGKPANQLKRMRRPALSAMVQPSDGPTIHSAYPILSNNESPGSGVSSGLPTTRRAFSALVSPAPLDQFSDESSFDDPDMSSPAQAYAKRQHLKTVRRCDGTEDFRPFTGATALTMKESPSSGMKESPSAKFMRGGIPGFGDNEAQGKILPCHRVTEDGLMRITVNTLDTLLDGKYDSQVTDYHIVDCRFDYEYAGGHIPGAVNINTIPALEAALLGPSLTKPKPTLSGDSSRKTLLIFHCEFSAKRAPTFAKHLRAKDRAMNNHVYPRIHYPEIYVLEGGYCQYYKESSARCEPQGYVRMDDPNHAVARTQDLDQFRKAKFGRHKSYAYGDGASKMSFFVQAQQKDTKQSKRNTAPSGPSGGPNTKATAASASRSRKGGSVSGLHTLAEDAHAAETDEEDLGDSPCPPPAKTGGRRILSRAATYDPRRFGL